MIDGFDLIKLLKDELKKVGIKGDHFGITKVRVIRGFKNNKEYETYVMTIPDDIAEKIKLCEGDELIYTDTVYKGESGHKIVYTVLAKEDIPKEKDHIYGKRKVRRRSSTLEIGIPKEYVEKKGLKVGDKIVLIVEKGATNYIIIYL